MSNAKFYYIVCIILVIIPTQLKNKYRMVIKLAHNA